MRVTILVGVAATTTSVSAQTKETNAPPPESTEKPASDFWTRKTLTGDWGGARKELEEKGISLQLYYNQQFQQNFKGGLDTHNGHRLSGSYDFDITLDFGKFGWMDDAGFYIRTTGTWSDGINPNKVGALNNVNSDAGDDHVISVGKWWFWKKFLDKKVELRLGLLVSNKDLFDVSPYANHEDKDFINRGSIRNATIPHRTGIGAFVKFQPVEWFYTQFATLDAQFQVRTTGFNTAFHEEPWFMAYWETGVTPKWKSAKGPMPGNLRVGVWYDPVPKTKFEDVGAAETKTGDVGYYFGADQLIWKECEGEKDTQGLGVFARYGHARADRNRISNYWCAGASYKGLVPERDRDVTGLAVSQSIMSERYADERHAGADRETAYEVYYAYEATPWCIISPHFQVITNPGGDKDDRDAIVGGVRVRISF